MIKQYETVFIATPVLSDAQMKEAVAKYTGFIKENGGEIVYEEDWGLRQLAYPIKKRTSGFYYDPRRECPTASHSPEIPAHPLFLLFQGDPPP